MKNLEKLILEAELYINDFGKSNLQISNSSVGWHLDHLLLTIIKITESLKNSDPNNYEWKFKILKYLVFITGNIPRGKAKSPKAVTPDSEITVDSLKIQFEKAKSYLDTLKEVKNNQFMEHPIFGKLKKNEAIKFLAIHTKHHLHIIVDILN